MDAPTSVVPKPNQGSEGTQTSASQATESPYYPKNAKGTLYEGGVHVPLCIAGPSVADGGRTTGALAHVADLFPTVLDIFDASGMAGAELDGVSLLPVLASADAQAPRSWLYTEAFGDTVPEGRSGRAARDERFKLLRLDGEAPALFDLDADPLEDSNLLGRTLSPEAQSALETLAGHLDAEP